MFLQNILAQRRKNISVMDPLAKRHANHWDVFATYKHLLQSMDAIVLMDMLEIRKANASKPITVIAKLKNKIVTHLMIKAVEKKPKK